MPIIGVTHEEDGRARLSRTVTTKVAIGLPPSDGSNHPQRLDHFVFLKKVQQGKELKWVQDDELTKHFKENCREFWIVFLDDDPDVVFRTEYAAFVKRGRWCCGDGVTAQRRDREKWGPMEPYRGPCAEGGCPLINKGECAPSGDLYFMLAEFPTLGTVCRIHTSSYQSIRQIHSALLELHRVTGGRLMGVRAKLFVAPDKNVYENNQGTTVTGIKWVLGLQLKANDLVEFSRNLLETAKTFKEIKGYLGGQTLEIVEDEEDRGAELTSEFYPGAPDPIVEDPELSLREQCDKLMAANGMNQASREQRLEQYRGRMAELLTKIQQWRPETNGHSRGTAAPSNGDTRTARPADPQPQTTTNNAQQAPTTAAPAQTPPTQQRPVKQGGFEF